MLTWLSENLVNIIIIAILVIVIGFLVRGMIRDRKAGKSPCGGNCSSCGGCAFHQNGSKLRPDKSAQLIQTKVAVDGMMCGMCEAHINEAVRKAIPVKKVSSSHIKGETLILTEEVPDTEMIRNVIDSTGYRVRSIESMQYFEKKALKPSFG